LLVSLNELPFAASQYSSLPTISLSNSSNNALAYSKPDSSASSSSSRFTTLPSAAPTPAPAPQPSPGPDSQYQLPPDMLSSLFSPSNPNALEAFLQFPHISGLGGTTLATGPPSTLAPSSIGPMASYSTTGGGIDFSRALLPSPSSTSATQANPLDILNLAGGASTSGTTSNALFSTSDFSDDFASAISDHSQVIRDVVSEKADIDQRTTALEAAIAKLMQALPEETREALSSKGTDGQGSVSPGIGGAQANGIGSAGGVGMMSPQGMQWATGDDGQLDLDKFLDQYGELSFSFALGHAAADISHSIQSTTTPRQQRRAQRQRKTPSITPSSLILLPPHFLRSSMAVRRVSSKSFRPQSDPCRAARTERVRRQARPPRTSTTTTTSTDLD
jgi:hypothetical protein